MELKKGDILIAVDPCIMDFSKEQGLILGKEYEILEVDSKRKTFYIKSEVFEDHEFDLKSFDEFFKLKTEQSKTERLKEIQFLIMRAYENGQKVELSLISELLNIIK